MKISISGFITLTLFVFMVFGQLSCKHEEGKGGLASISGKIYGKDFNSSGILVSEGYIGNVKVYISKHGESNYFDDYDSSYDGSFKFDFLYPGKYDIWVFGDCDSCSWDQVYELRTVEINGKREDISIDDIIITL